VLAPYSGVARCHVHVILRHADDASSETRVYAHALCLRDMARYDGCLLSTERIDVMRVISAMLLFVYGCCCLIMAAECRDIICVRARDMRAAQAANSESR